MSEHAGSARIDSPPPELGNRAAPTGVARDPVCGMAINEPQPGLTVEFDGRQYVFCSAACRARFLVSPERYAPSERGAP